MISLITAVLALIGADERPRLQETIVVTASRTEEPRIQSAGAITVITRDELAALPAETLGDALRFLPGLQVISVLPGAPEMISSRGFFGAGEVEYVQLLVDGAPVADAESGLADWRAVPLESIERIEVLRGAASSLFGDRAIGGVVQVFRRRENAIAIRAGSFATREVRGSGRVIAGRATTVETDIRRLQSNGAREHSAWNETVGSAVLRQRAGGGDLTVSIDASAREREEPGPRSRSELTEDRFGSSTLFQGDEERSERTRAAVRYATPVLEASLYRSTRHSELDRTLLLAPGLGDSAHRTLEATSLGATARATATVGRRLRIVAGADLGRDSLHTRYATALADAAGEGRRRQVATYAAAEWTISDRMRLTTGARWDAVDDRFGDASASDDAISPRVGINLLTGRSETPLALFASASRAFKAPTLDQRFDPRPLPDFRGGTFTISNSELTPQQATTIELGARRDLPHLAWEAVAYWMDVDDEIDFDLATFRYANIGRSRHVGVESSAHFRRQEPIALRTTYTWTRVEPMTGSNRGRQLKNIAEHTGRADVIVRGPISATLSVTHEAGRFADDANRFPLGDSTMVDLRLRRDFGPVRITADIRNLLGQHYTPLGFTLTGFDGTDVPFYYPGTPRTIDVNFTWTIPAKGGHS